MPYTLPETNTTPSTNSPFSIGRPGIGQRGITLLEVLVAMVIFSVAISVGMNTLGDSIRATRHIDTQTYAHWVAQNRMAEILMQPRWPELGRNDGETEKMMGHVWYWETEVKKTSAKNLRRIEVSIKLDENSDTVNSFLVGFVGKKEK